jgi:regulator of sirC expression with transglutaminase-like and TPR domain
MTLVPPFAEIAATADAPMDVMALALASEFRPVDGAAALLVLDGLGEELARVIQSTPATRAAETDVRACAHVLHATHGFAGNQERYDDPANSMLDVVLETRRGLPILLSVLYVEVARRADVPLAGIGLAGHFVVGHFGANPPVLLDPFNGGTIVEADLKPGLHRPWRNQEITMRMLNNLVGSYERRGDFHAAIRAAEMRLELQAPRALRDTLRAELRALQARLN